MENICANTPNEILVRNLEALREFLPEEKRELDFVENLSITAESSQSNLIHRRLRFVSQNREREWRFPRKDSHTGVPCARYADYDPQSQWLLLMGVDALCPDCLRRVVTSQYSPALIIEPDWETFLAYSSLFSYEELIRDHSLYWFLDRDCYSNALSSLDARLEPYFITCSSIHLIVSQETAAKTSTALHSFLSTLKTRFNEKRQEIKELTSSFHTKYQSKPYTPSKTVMVIEPAVSCWIQLGNGLASGFRGNGYEVVELQVDFPPSSITPYDSLKLLLEVRRLCPDYIITLSHPPDLFVRGIDDVPIPRLIWYVDEPDHLLQVQHGPYDYLFPVWEDFKEKLRSRGGRLLDEIPVAGFPHTFIQKNEYTCEVGFVGTIRNTQPVFQQLSHELAQKIDAIVDEKLGAVKMEFSTLFKHYEITPNDLNTLITVLTKDYQRHGMTDEQTFLFFLHIECARRRRVRLLESLSEFDLKIYGNADWEAVLVGSRIESAFQKKTLPLDECYNFYHSAKIALSVHPSYIHSGPTLREMDIVLCDGFTLSDMGIHTENRMEEFFKPGSEITLFKNEMDLPEKVKHYLARPEERKSITEAAKARIHRDHHYTKRVERMLSLLRK